MEFKEKEMNIYETIMVDIKSAMIDKNNTKRDCLRAIVSEIKNQTVNTGKELTDEICIKVIQKSAKQHNDSIDSFKLGKREDLALKEMEELKYIETYLPKMVSEDEALKLYEQSDNFNEFICNAKKAKISVTILFKYKYYYFLKTYFRFLIYPGFIVPITFITIFLHYLT